MQPGKSLARQLARVTVRVNGNHDRGSPLYNTTFRGVWDPVDDNLSQHLWLENCRNPGLPRNLAVGFFVEPLMLPFQCARHVLNTIAWNVWGFK